MGLFSDICPECGSKVSKRARFCPKCGHGAPSGWTKCPQCGKWVANDAKFCSGCNHRLFPEDRIDLAGGVWARKPGEFARRFELDDVSFLKKSGLLVQEGTTAILLENGKAEKELGPGRHQPLGTLRFLNWFGNPPPRSAVMIDSGECVFRVDFTGGGSGTDAVGSAPLRTAEEMEIGCVAEITLKYIPGKSGQFIANVMKEARSVTMTDICSILYANALSAVRDLCLQSTVEDLVKDPARRERFEEAICRALRANLEGWGLEIIRAGAVEFYGPAYEDMRAKYGELEKARRLVEFGKAKLEVLAAEAEQEAESGKRDAKREQELKEYLEQLAQEKQLSDLDRDRELKIAELASQGAVSAAEAKQAAARELEEHAQAMTGLAHRLELDLTLKDYNREQLVKDAENKARVAAVERSERLKDAQLDTAVSGEKVKQAKLDDEIERIRIDRELWEQDRYLDLRSKKEKIKNAALRERGEIVAGKSGMELAAMASDDPAARQAFLEHELAKLKMDRESAMTPEQILALKAGESAAAADAVARMAEAGGKAAAAALEERRKMDAERLAHDEKLEDRLFSLAGTAVERQTTVVPPAPVTNMQH
ncbi:MAG: zinc-ribbon domain-containing protein [Kiritimatiellae bacterium]|nr:zinc-ribbon domain-containing protein [Kiritimatiellia bacterium]